MLIVPSPAGIPFTQELARDLAGRQQLVFACGRYEGIDQRVVDHFAERAPGCIEVSLGDYVLNGGEVAALAIIEAVARLVPGVIGNPESLAEESHEDGLLEYPSYTKPAQWRGLDVPSVLAERASWRGRQVAARAAARAHPPGAARPAADRSGGRRMNAFWFWLQVVVAAVAVVLSGWAWAGVVAELRVLGLDLPAGDHRAVLHVRCRALACA